MAPQQLTFPLNEYPLRNRDKRAKLYFQMHALADAEDRALVAVEDEDNEGWEAADAELDRAIVQAQSFYAAVIAPVYRSWWLA